MSKKRMKDDERCKDCEETMADPDFGHGGDPSEIYIECGCHICGKKNPRVYKVKIRSEESETKDTTPKKRLQELTDRWRKERIVYIDISKKNDENAGVAMGLALAIQDLQGIINETPGSDCCISRSNWELRK